MALEIGAIDRASLTLRISAKVALGNVLDGHARGMGQLGGALAHPILQRFGKLRIVEDPELPGREKSRHSLA